MTSKATAQAGLDAVVPFQFDCHRCGHCCTAGEGFVWIEAEEIEPMAGQLGMSAEAFSKRFVRQVADPGSGALRLSLIEDPASPPGNGHCALLEDGNHCSVYAARPAHCRSFPFWNSILTDKDAFERARSTCPGIRVVVDEQVQAAAFAALEELYAQLDAVVARSQSVCILRGRCCHFEEAGHRLYASALEADYAAANEPEAPSPEAPGRCPYHVNGLCTARDARPMGCRTYFCDTRTEAALLEVAEHFRARLRELEREYNYPAVYADFPTLMAARGVGVHAPSAGEVNMVQDTPGRTT